LATAVFLSFPVHGHIAPALGVVSELVQRGERVLFFATERSRAKVESTGAEFCRYRHRHDEFNPDPPTEGLFSDMARLSALTEQLVPEILEQLSGEQVDYLLVDTKSLWGRLVAQVLKLPAITFSVVFALRPGIVQPPELVKMLYGGATQDGLLRGLTGLNHYLETVRRIDHLHGTVSPGIVEYLGNPHSLNIIFTSREFQIGEEAFDRQYQFVGPSLLPGRDAAIDFPFEKLAASKPLVYISLGTTFFRAAEFYWACFQAFADKPWQIVLSCGRDGRAELGEPPKNFLVAEFVPQMPLLERTSLFITHGGMNSANEGLSLGVPLLVVPQRGDQFLVGGRVAELGAGLMLHPSHASAENLRLAATRILEAPSFAAAAEALGTSLREAGGYRYAADQVLAYVAPALEHEEWSLASSQGPRPIP
jgi:MGT family glycosyltransferase